MKAIDFDADVAKKIRKIRTKDKKLFIKIQKQLRLFQNDPHHNSLKLHKLGGSLKNIWSISIDRSIRMLYMEIEETIYFIDIGTHDEVYKK